MLGTQRQSSEINALWTVEGAQTPWTKKLCLETYGRLISATISSQANLEAETMS